MKHRENARCKRDQSPRKLYSAVSCGYILPYGADAYKVPNALRETPGFKAISWAFPKAEALVHLAAALQNSKLVPLKHNEAGTLSLL